MKTMECILGMVEYCNLLMCYHVILYTHSDVSVQVAVEMPFKIRTIQSPTHKLRIKVYTYYYHHQYVVYYCVWWIIHTYVCMCYVKHCMYL